MPEPQRASAFGLRNVPCIIAISFKIWLNHEAPWWLHDMGTEIQTLDTWGLETSTVDWCLVIPALWSRWKSVCVCVAQTLWNHGFHLSAWTISFEKEWGYVMFFFSWKSQGSLVRMQMFATRPWYVRICLRCTVHFQLSRWWTALTWHDISAATGQCTNVVGMLD